jgi:nitrogen regulatory protein PII
MKAILAVVKPFRAQAVLAEILQFGVDHLQVSEARGFGRQKDQLPRYVGSEYSPVYLPKIEIRMLVQDHLAEPIVERIAEVARTGRQGDGKVVVLPVLGAIDL